MPYHHLTRPIGWAGLLFGTLLIVASCGDDSGSVPFGQPLDEDPGSLQLEPTPETSEITDSVGPPTGVDRSAELVGPWAIVNYTLSDSGNLTNIVGDVTPFVEFMADGTLTFQTGCNGGNATWEASGDYVVPSPLDDEPAGQPIQISTINQDDAECDGFLGEQDVDLVTNMEKAERFLLSDDGGMSLLDEFVLIRAEPA